MAAGLHLESVLTSAALTAFFHEELEEIWTRDLHGIEGGMDRLPHGIAARLETPPRMGCEVIAIEQDPSRGKAAAIYRQGGGEHREEGDFVLCTPPFPVLRTLAAAPSFSGAKQRAIRQLQYESATKVLAVTERRFWETDDGIYGGSTFTDLPSQATVYPSDNAEARDPAVAGGPGVLLASFTWGKAAQVVDRLPAAARAEFQMSQVAKIHPQLNEAGMVRGSVAWSWDEHPWARGGFAFPAPGQRSLLRDAAAPEGRIHFAGEHCSLNHGWIQGALESALLAVRNMLGRDL
jgi:monoamine oxidase